MKTSVIIPCWITNSHMLKITQQCIDSFRNTTGEPLELILIDNASEIGGGYLRDVADIYIRFPQNVGFTPAINIGMKVANGDVIALANNDIRVPSNWESVCREILKDPVVATVHPKMMFYDDPFEFGDFTAIGGRERWCGGSLFATTRKFLNYMRDMERDMEPYPGLYDENFGIGGGGDDWDWVNRVRHMGNQAYTNKTAFQHVRSLSLRTLGKVRSEVNKQNDEYFTKKWNITKEELFHLQFPKQMKIPYEEGFI